MGSETQTNVVTVFLLASTENTKVYKLRHQNNIKLLFFFYENEVTKHLQASRTAYLKGSTLHLPAKMLPFYAG